jgi:hypothetical protein
VVAVVALEPGAGQALEAAERERAAEREQARQEAVAPGPVVVEGVPEQFTG